MHTFLQKLRRTKTFPPPQPLLKHQFSHYGLSVFQPPQTSVHYLLDRLTSAVAHAHVHERVPNRMFCPALTICSLPELMPSHHQPHHRYQNVCQGCLFL
ncbi:unnamed protein product [Periconia digitata]|uniref:Uncharacterized protein n=1 Tax=Periconia digitata TaxID=1303443 RepID=A0A9W4UK07_9PLEO|nr:unnamed protein product [Periconia digitata]